ncbi:MAG: XRE family transcriptional regulator [Rivularia sp. T60_A2020_040]|nr:XRE family transcriptional regulator [Rivularia sp. T60_A2020_040]
MTQEVIFEESSGNVFADLGLEDADELFTRGKIGIQVIRLLKQRNLKQREISELLGIPQPEVSHLMKGEFQRFSEGKLLIFLKRLDMEITLYLRPRNSDNKDFETALAKLSGGIAL